MKHLLRLLLVAVASLAFVAPALAPADAAVAPKKGGVYVGDGPNQVKVTANGKAVKQFFFQTSLTQCTAFPFNTSKLKPAIRKGKFTWKGKVKDVLKKSHTLSITGTFMTKKKLKVVVIEKSCHTKKRAFVLKAK